MFPLQVAILIGAMIVSLTVLQTIKVYAYAGKAKTVMASALTACSTNNYTGVYYGLREGNTGDYIPDGKGNYASGVNNQEIENYLVNNLGFKKDGAGYSKKGVGGSEMYSIGSVTVKVTNTADGSSDFTETTSFTFSTPFPVAGDILPYISIPMMVSSGYVTRY